MAVSADTLLRLARREPTTSAPPPRHLGIDDFALRKGQVYGTILVDLEAHQPVDLIPERSAEVVEEWLQAHPGVEVITRDRSGEYVEGASRGAPNALQVADRFHLLQNVREMLQRLLDGQQKALQATTQEPASSSDTQPGLERQTSVAAEALAEPVSAGVSKLVPVPVEPPSLPLSKAAQLSQARRARRHDRYTAVRELHAQGVGLRAIAAQLQLSRNTVRRYVAADQFPEQATRRPRRRLLEPFIPYLEAQLAAGQENALQLWRELREHHRYTGSRALVSRWVAQHRHLVPLPEPNSPPRRQRGRPPAASAPPATPPQHRLSARQAAWLLVREPKKLEEEEQRLVERLCTHAPKVEQAYRLAQEFMQMVRERQAERFDDWLQRASTSGLAELQGFVVGLERDKAAVVAALSLPYSNGQVEGQVNRLKLIKRSMYGRAKFDLLRQRVLARSS
jgi:transposase